MFYREHHHHHHHHYHLLEIIMMVMWIPWLFVSILLFCRYSTSVYLLVLAVSDTMCLWIALPKHTYNNLFDLDYRNISYIHCKFVDWLGFSSGSLSTWTVVNLTIERVLLTLYPIKAKMKLTPKVSVIVSMTTVVASQFLSAPLIFSSTYSGSALENSTNVSSCTISSKEFSRFYITAWQFIAMLWYNVLPVAIIITGNALIGTVLLKRKKQVHPTSTRNQHNLAREKMALKMLFAISFFHVIFTSPFSIYLIMRINSTLNSSPKEMAVDQLKSAVLHILLFCNYTFNFALYFVRGSLFREEFNELVALLKNMFIKCRERRGASNGISA